MAFEVKRLQGWSGDVSIDDVFFTDGSCPDSEYVCEFEQGYCNWHNDPNFVAENLWKRNNAGPFLKSFEFLICFSLSTLRCFHNSITVFLVFFSAFVQLRLNVFYKRKYLDTIFCLETSCIKIYLYFEIMIQRYSQYNLFVLFLGEIVKSPVN